MRPPIWVDGPTSRDEAATGRRAAKAHRKAARTLVQGNVIAQCDACGATDDAEHSASHPKHNGCTGRFRFYGVPT